ncbi:hypothetical protein RSOLAG1IB_02970 [Rhizoctonia solani AG-1 IB]|uniref:Uncharacterized protein n=1 Tax=Thanatephorus cucumeris (strain AG1-IB / isolate 7/3/14) TaxID=1108050 RepID=A0A0B7FMU5_THACB|nr:hypothetical protein RSOLAG1IB_02970 [Rhizoctonia solani AG-1 IB]
MAEYSVFSRVTRERGQDEQVSFGPVSIARCGFHWVLVKRAPRVSGLYRLSPGICNWQYPESVRPRKHP